MASITNRSNYLVTVRNRGDLTRSFAHDKHQDAKKYFAQLRAQRFQPRVEQQEDIIFVRLRDKGYTEQSGTFESMVKAEEFIKRVELDRAQGLDYDYLKARSVTFVDLLERYMREEGPKSPKTWESVGKYRAQRMWRGATGQFNARDRKRLAKNLKVLVEALPKTLQPDYPWMQKPFSALTTVDIESYIPERQEEGVSNATIDRELDVISAICSVATKVWGYNVKANPMVNVRRPKYFNERDRRLKGDEEDRLLAAARSEDRRRCEELCLMELVEQWARQEPGFQFLSRAEKNRKRRLWRQKLSAQARSECLVIPCMEVFVEFQLGTAARRGEALALVWEDVDFVQDGAHFPMTKNGRPRTVPLSEWVKEALQRLPHRDGRVFALSVDYVKNAWYRMSVEAKIEDFHIHDLRHEALSRIAETGKFSVADLQSISGHLDVRMLLRYLHLCTRKLADRLNDALGTGRALDTHRGRQRLTRSASVSMREAVGMTQSNDLVDSAEPAPEIVRDSTASGRVVMVDFAARRRVA
ncbi:site-specific integrase [Alcaligenaceae bacterium]|nr:site-specific integrase [Alcaligenaceae bacterium]